MSNSQSDIQSNLASLLIAPREELHVEIKTWLNIDDNADKSKIAKAIISIANYGGGYLLIGFDEKGDGTFEPSTNKPVDLNKYSQDSITAIVKSYADPSFQCDVHFVKRPNSVDTFPVVSIPGDHRVPIQCKKGSPDQKSLIPGRYYVRQPGPESAEPKNPEVWREMINRCIRAGRDDLLNVIRDVLSGHQENKIEIPENEIKNLLDWSTAGIRKWLLLPRKNIGGVTQEHPGGYRVSYKVLGEFEKPSLTNLLHIIDKSTVRHTGWSPFWVPTKQPIAPKPRDGFIECFLGEDNDSLITNPACADFWRVSTAGYALLIRGFDEDSYPEKHLPKSVFDITLPIWRIGECMLQASQLAKNLRSGHADVVFHTKWFGLKGRRLISWSGERHMSGRYIAEVDEYENSITFNTESIEDLLPEILYNFLSNLYGLFNFFQLQQSTVVEELRKLKANRF